MTRRLLLSRSPGETRVALVANDRLLDYQVRRDHVPSRLGGIYLARLRKVTGDGRLAFADIGGVEVMADLDAKSAGLAGWTFAEGALVPVQITQEARRGRLARGTTRLGLVGPRLVFLPQADTDGVSHRLLGEADKGNVAGLLPGIERDSGGFIARRGARGAALEILRAEAGVLMADWESCMERHAAARSPGILVAPPAPGVDQLRDTVEHRLDEIVSDDRIAAEPLAAFCRNFFLDSAGPARITVAEMAAAFADIEDQIEAALARRVPIPGGGSLTVERTEGMTAVDIDSGAAFDGASSGRGAQELNRRAAAEIAGQLRVRALGGLIAVDLVGSPRGKVAASVLAAFRTAFRNDPARVEIDLVENRGVVLLSRQWSRQPLDEVISAAIERTEGPAPESFDTIVFRALRAARIAVARSPMTRLTVHLASAVAGHWHSPHLSGAVAELEEAIGMSASIEAHEGWPDARVEIGAD